MNNTRFIVAEVSKNWLDGDHAPGSDATILCQRFEAVIETNLQRGYRLLSFSLHRLLTGPKATNETIIAVFERIAP